MYKIGTPYFDDDPDWTITLSQLDFPWKEIKFGDFTTAECYEKYKISITDELLFNKFVRGET